MKKIFLIAAVLLTLSFNSQSLAQGPPDPPDNPASGGGPVGGSAPVGEGGFLFLALSAGYAAKKWKNAKKSDDEQ